MMELRLHATTPERRDAIVAAALACFAEKGVEATSIADIRRASGASVGSLYHHFGGKEELAGRVYLAVLEQYQASYLAALKRARTAEDAVKGTVRHYLSWVRRHPDAARLLTEGRRTPQVMAADRDIRDATKRFFDASNTVFSRFVDGGAMKRVAVHLLPLLLVAPATAAARQWLESGGRFDLGAAEALLTDAAWAALRPSGANSRQKGKRS